MKKLISIFLSALLIVSVICCAPFAVSAAEDNDSAAGVLSGTTGDCTWELDPSTGVLTISGSGAMADYDWDTSIKVTNAPWWDYREKITSLVIGSGVTDIGDYSFCSCALSEVVIPDSVISIGDDAFEYNKDLSKVTFGKNVKTIGGWVFNGCDFSRVVIPDSTEVIGKGAFYNNSDLTELTLGECVTSIGKYAFENCGLTEVTIPATVTEIGEYVFGYEFKERYEGGPWGDCPIEGFTINGCSGTAAETYANDNGFTFVDLGAVETTVTSNSNFYGTKSVTYNGGIPSQVIIDYYCATDAYWLLNGHWKLNYDPEVLQLSDEANMEDDEYTMMPVSNNGGGVIINNMPESGSAVILFSDVNCVKLCEKDGTPIPVLHFVFDVVGTGNTEVDLDTIRMTFMEANQPHAQYWALVFNKDSEDGGKAAIDQLINDGGEIYTVIQPEGSSPSVLIGDVNGDNSVDVLDAAMIQKYAAGKADLTAEQLTAGDVNGDHNVDVLDAAMIQKYAAGKINHFPVEK